MNELFNGRVEWRQRLLTADNQLTTYEQSIRGRHGFHNVINHVIVITWHHQVRQTLHTWVPQTWTVLQHNTQLSWWSPDIITRWDRHCTPECHRRGQCYNTIHNCHSDQLTSSPGETDTAHLSATDLDSATTQYTTVMVITWHRHQVRHTLHTWVPLSQMWTVLQHNSKWKSSSQQNAWKHRCHQCETLTAIVHIVSRPVLSMDECLVGRKLSVGDYMVLW